MRFSFDHCVVCGATPTGRTGYLFRENGKTVVGMPYCKKHLDEAGLTLANPVFENEEALRIFREIHPDKYVKYVKGKSIVFLKREFAVKEVVWRYDE